MKNKILKLIFLLLMPLIPVLCLFPVRDPDMLELALTNYQLGAGTPTMLLESYVRQNMPYGARLVQLGLGLAMAGGQKEVVAHKSNYPYRSNGIFIGPDSLMKNIDPPVLPYVQENTDAIIRFGKAMRQNRVPTYVALIPTSGAIMQQKLPVFASAAMVNQNQFIEGVYNRLSENVTAIDAYGALLSRNTRYIYYRTENNLTALGGYFVYSAMLARMDIGVASLGQYDIEYPSGEFYGDLCRESGYAAVEPDSISLYRYSKSNRNHHEYLVTHTEGGEYKAYHTLFPLQQMRPGNELDVYLGGISALTDVHSSAQSSVRLLVFGDKTALAYLPFLADNCARVTLIDLFYGKQEFSSLNLLDYDKILFAYGVETFMHTNNPARALSLLPEEYIAE